MIKLINICSITLAEYQIIRENVRVIIKCNESEGMRDIGLGIIGSTTLEMLLEGLKHLRQQTLISQN
jgi:hypothetical protein